MNRIEQLLDIMRRLRDPENGCPWDRAQTFDTIAPYTIEEAYEVADAVERGDLEDLKGELGDLLFQVVFHAQMAAEAGRFDFDRVVEAITDKLVRRHPHVFGDASIDSAAVQTRAWEMHKAHERRARSAAANRRASLLDDIPAALPALSRAMKLQQRAAAAGFDWHDPRDIMAKFKEELTELRAALNGAAHRETVAGEIGDLLFTLVNAARRLDCDAEDALRRTNRKFERRFQYMEQALSRQKREFKDVTLDEMEALWQEAKRNEGDGDR